MINRRKLILTSFYTGLSLFSYNKILAQEAVKKTSSVKHYIIFPVIVIRSGKITSSLLLMVQYYQIQSQNAYTFG